MGKFLALLLVTVSLLALLHSYTIYQRSYYLESSDRVELNRLIDNVEQLERPELLELSQRLVTISRSDYGILLILNREFRNSIIYLALCLVTSLLALGWVILRPLLVHRIGT